MLYVHGNHDACYDETPPEGCICIEDQIYMYRGVRILGLGGSMKYNYGPYQYTDAEMRRRILKLRLKIQRRGGFDILVAHSPALGINDGDDIPHRGFMGLTELLIDYSPTLFLHGHVHMSYDRNIKREEVYMDTRVINAYERYVFDVEIPDNPPKRGLFFRRPEGRKSLMQRRKQKKEQKKELTGAAIRRRSEKDAAERRAVEEAAARQRSAGEAAAQKSADVENAARQKEEMHDQQ